MTESIGVLFIFLILLAIGSIFMVNVFQGSLERTKEENLQLKAIDVAQRISFLPELQCSQENIVIEPCIDLLKLNATKEMINLNPQYLNDYYPILGYSNITIKRIFPQNDTQWNLYNTTPNKILNRKQIHLPTALYNPLTKSHDFGWIEVNVYQ